RYSEGEQFEIDVSGVKLDGATKAFIIFDKNGKLAAIVIEFSGNKFDSLYKSLNGQYKARRKILREDNKFARFSIVNGEVRLIEPRDSFTTTLIYATTQMWEKAESSVLQK
ncbi:MAG: hypothetical protein LBO72_10830, partial [Helicobacteraceae bacterium]|nr:hypothetical protein [Helicobacteraceae bacterium]